MSLFRVFHTLDVNTISLESSSDLDSNVNLVFVVKDKYQMLAPPSEDGIRHIVREVDGLTMTRVSAIKLSDLIVYDITEKYVHHILSCLYLLPLQDFHKFTEKISTLACEAAKAALEKRSKFRITVDVEVLVREECEDIEAIGGDEEPSFKEVRASRSSVEALETKKYDEGESVETCMVCMEEFFIGVDVTRMPCSHIFHGGCIVKWLENRNLCPLCRFEMPTES